MKLITTLSFLLLTLFPQVLSAEVKVATVDVNRIMNELPEAKSKKKEIDEKSASVRKKIEAQRALLTEQEKHLKGQKASDSSPDAEKFRNDARSYERLIRDSDEDLRKDFLKLNKDLADKVLKVIRAYAQERKIDLILDKNEKGSSSVIYGESSADITEDIIKQLNP